MDPAFIQQVRTAFLAALERPPAARDEFVVRACGNDPALLRLVRQLLRHAAAADDDAARRARPTASTDEGEEPES